MRRVLAAAVALAALLPATARAELKLVETEQLTDRLTALTFTTPSLNFPADVRVLLPRSYVQRPRRHYPVLYLLHGSFDTAASWADKGDAEAITAGKPLIVVMPDTAGHGRRRRLGVGLDQRGQRRAAEVRDVHDPRADPLDRHATTGPARGAAAVRSPACRWAASAR